ncbi:hypothetical protein B0H17DRAFT_403555 [Mycena rosella]|uniref:Uncharacterized protein n=1 Tax=Mycena rosella TaxID=1033263 RepID=A0AAD7G0F8_MYCRO|nr:hypothetical protein B0H17DRAFT_403555 [Mycena rosella]
MPLGAVGCGASDLMGERLDGVRLRGRGVGGGEGGREAPRLPASSAFRFIGGEQPPRHGRTQRLPSAALLLASIYSSRIPIPAPEHPQPAPSSFPPSPAAARGTHSACPTLPTLPAGVTTLSAGPSNNGYPSVVLAPPAPSASSSAPASPAVFGALRSRTRRPGRRARFDGERRRSTRARTQRLPSATSPSGALRTTEDRKGDARTRISRPAPSLLGGSSCTRVSRSSSPYGLDRLYGLLPAGATCLWSLSPHMNKAQMHSDAARAALASGSAW